MTLYLTEKQIDELHRQATVASPEECCGVLIGRSEPGSSTVLELWLGRNVAPGDRRLSYSIRPLDLLAAHRRARHRGLEVVGYYHSHPVTAAEPSATDLAAAWPEVSYLIVGCPAAQEREVRSWRLEVEGRFVEERLSMLSTEAQEAV